MSIVTSPVSLDRSIRAVVYRARSTARKDTLKQGKSSPHSPPGAFADFVPVNFHRRTHAAKCSCDSVPRGHIFLFARATTTTVVSAMPATATTTTLTSRGVSRDVNGVKTFRRAYARDDRAPNEDMNMGVVAVALCRNMATRIAQCYGENRRGMGKEREQLGRGEGDVGLERVCAPKRTERERQREGEGRGGCKIERDKLESGGESENEIEVLRRSIRHQLKLQ